MLLFAVAVITGFKVPPLNTPVTDLAGMISPGVEQQINGRLQALWQSGGSQIAVLTVPNLEGLPIEQASIQVVDQWKLGTAKDDNGILLLISRDDRSLRIEVGQGLEGSLPDAYARRIVDDVITPYFKEGRYDIGVLAGLNAIVQRTDEASYPLFNTAVGAAQTRQVSAAAAEHRAMPWPMRIFLLVVICFLIFTRTGRTILFAMLVSGMTGRRSGGGFGGGGGGGFGGGGGGFSGGGASGRW